MRELALFAGAGGGILGGLLLGWRTVCAVEIDPYARSVLLARQNDGTLAPFPIWDDIRTFDGRPWRGIVDVVSGGFPCQDISVAGSGKGLDGERSGLWVEMARVIREVGPRHVFVENSPALVTRGLDRVLGDLAAMGFDAEWGVVSAADCGAPHRRERIWIAADADQDGRNAVDAWQGGARGRHSVQLSHLANSGAIHADDPFRAQDELRAAGKLSAAERAEIWPTPKHSDHRPGHASRANDPRRRNLNDRVMLPTPTAGDAKASGSRNTASSKAHPGVSLTDWIRGDGGTGRMWPTPRAEDSQCAGEHRGKDDTLYGAVCRPKQLPDSDSAGRQEQWIDESDIGGGQEQRSPQRGGGWPPEPGVGRVVDGMAHRVDRLKALGNGQVSRVAATAWRILTSDKQ